MSHAEINVSIIQRSDTSYSPKGRSAVAAAAYRAGEALKLDKDSPTLKSEEGKMDDHERAARSAIAAAAYRAGEELQDTLHHKPFSYTKKHHILYTEILAPKDAPEWATNRERLWNEVEKREKRKDAQLAREVLLILPRELDTTHQIAMVRAYVKDVFVREGMVADIALHAPDAKDGGKNPHAHVLLTMRPLGAEGWHHYKNGAHKGDRDHRGRPIEHWNKDYTLRHWRTMYEHYLNAALEDAGATWRADLRSNKDKGLDREPEPKLGPHVAALEREGIRTDRGDQWRGVQRRNALIAYHETMRKQPWARDGDHMHNAGWTGVEIATASSSKARQAAAERHEEVRRRLEDQHAQKITQRNQQLLFQQNMVARKQQEQQRQQQRMQQRALTQERER